MRKHHSRAAALAVRLLTAWAYALRALAATVDPGRPARVYCWPTPARRCSPGAARACATATVRWGARESSSHQLGLVDLGDAGRLGGGAIAGAGA